MIYIGFRGMLRNIIYAGIGFGLGVAACSTGVAEGFTGTLSNNLFGGSRNFDTTYQNTSTEDLFVSVFVENDSSSNGAYIRVDSNSAHVVGPYDADFEVGNTGNTAGINGNAWNSGWVVVPPNFYYRVSEGGAYSRVWWNEYLSPAITSGGGSSTAAVAATTTIHNPTQDMFNGFVVFFFVFVFFVWFFRRPYDTF